MMPIPDAIHRNPTRGVLLLVAATVVGCVAAAESPARAAKYAHMVPAGAVAVVNGTPIRDADYATALGSIAADKRDPLTEDDQRLALTRLIEEELLVQEGLARGLHQRNRRVRDTVVQAMLTSVLADSRSEQPPEGELRAYYETNRLAVTAAAYGLPLDIALERGVAAPPFETVRDLVAEACAREAQDTAVTAYIAWLREDADITLAPEYAR